MLKLLIVSIVLLFGSALGESVKFNKCPEQSARQCTISNVVISPCPEALEGLPCRVKKGRSVTIEFDLTPEFALDKIHSQAYWANGRTDLPFIGMETDGCKSAECPINAGTTKHYQWTLDVSKKFPTRQYNVKMKLENEAEPENFCCFLFPIKLIK